MMHDRPIDNNLRICQRQSYLSLNPIRKILLDRSMHDRIVGFYNSFLGLPICPVRIYRLIPCKIHPSLRRQIQPIEQSKLLLTRKLLFLLSKKITPCYLMVRIVRNCKRRLQQRAKRFRKHSKLLIDFVLIYHIKKNSIARINQIYQVFLFSCCRSDHRRFPHKEKIIKLIENHRFVQVTLVNQVFVLSLRSQPVLHLLQTHFQQFSRAIMRSHILSMSYRVARCQTLLLIID